MPRSLEELSQAAGDLLEAGRPAEALQVYASAVKLAQEGHRQRELSDLLGDMAVAYRRTGDTASAIGTNRLAIEAARASAYDLNVARWSGNLGGLLYNGGDLDGAEACFRDAAMAAARLGDPRQMSIAGGHFGSLMGERGRFSEAVAELEHACAIAGKAPDVLAIVREQQADLFCKWAYSLRQGRRQREARDVINRAFADLGDAVPGKAAVMLLMLLADLDENDGNVVGAVATIERAAKVAEASGDGAHAAELRDLGRRMRG